MVSVYSSTGLSVAASCVVGSVAVGTEEGLSYLLTVYPCQDVHLNDQSNRSDSSARSSQVHLWLTSRAEAPAHADSACQVGRPLLVAAAAVMICPFSCRLPETPDLGISLAARKDTACLVRGPLATCAHLWAQCEAPCAVSLAIMPILQHTFPPLGKAGNPLASVCTCPHAS